MLTDSQIIDALGGNRAVAKLCAPKRHNVVSGWRKRGIPIAWRRFLEVTQQQAFIHQKADIQTIADHEFDTDIGDKTIRDIFTADLFAAINKDMS